MTQEKTPPAGQEAGEEPRRPEEEAESSSKPESGQAEASTPRESADTAAEATEATEAAGSEPSASPETGDGSDDDGGPEPGSEPVAGYPPPDDDTDPSAEPGYEDPVPAADAPPPAEPPAGEPPAGGPPSEDGGDDDEDEDGEELHEMSFLEHLEELRKRLVRCVAAAIVGSLACYAFSKQMFDMLMEPMVNVLHQSKFIYTYPPEAFFTYIKISLVAGVFLTSPYIFYQIWSFIAPALYKEERKWFIPIAIVSAVFFTTGALFGYFIVFPYGFDFFASFTTENIQFMPKLSEYLGFSLKLLFAFGVVFELPLFVFFLARLGIVGSRGMRKKRKYAILIAFIVAAILTPPDPFTQSLMAGPLIILYEMSIWVAYFFGKKDRKEREEKRAQAAGPDGDAGETATDDAKADATKDATADAESDAPDEGSKDQSAEGQSQAETADKD